MIDGLKITGVWLSYPAACRILEQAVTAGSHGIGYWAQVRDHKRSERYRGLIMLQIEDVVGAVEGEEPKRYTLRPLAIRKAVTRMLMDPHGTESACWNDRLVGDCDTDGPLCDAIVQVACFGKILYA